MADQKNTPSGTANPAGVVDAKDAPKNLQGGIPSPDGDVANQDDGTGTIQREPTPEEYPAAAKVAPPSYQVNPSGDTAVGTLYDKTLQNTANDAYAEATAAHAGVVNAASETAQKVADLSREFDAKLAEITEGSNDAKKGEGEGPLGPEVTTDGSPSKKS